MWTITPANGRTFFANDADPALPADLAAHVRAIAGLSDRARPAPLSVHVPPEHYFQCPADQDPAYCDLYGPLCAIYAGSRATGEFLMDLEGEGKAVKDYVKSYNSYNDNVQDYYEKCLDNDFGRPESIRTLDGGGVPWNQIDGSGQTIGLVEFDLYQPSDISAFLELIGAPPEQIAHLSDVIIGAGASFGGAESEVVLDIDVVMSLAPAADVVVYSAAFSGAGSFQQVFNRMVSDGVDVISNSWAYCESQTTQADVDSIDAILQGAAVAGISVFSGSGDTGSTCLDGSANTVAVPASAPHITAVGGTSLAAGAGGVRQGETWWDGSTHQPQTGTGRLRRQPVLHAAGVPEWFVDVADALGARRLDRRGSRDRIRHLPGRCRRLSDRIALRRHEHGGAGLGRVHFAAESGGRNQPRIRQRAFLSARRDGRIPRRGVDGQRFRARRTRLA